MKSTVCRDVNTRTRAIEASQTVHRIETGHESDAEQQLVRAIALTTRELPNLRDVCKLFKVIPAVDPGRIKTCKDQFMNSNDKRAPTSTTDPESARESEILLRKISSKIVLITLSSFVFAAGPSI